MTSRERRLPVHQGHKGLEGLLQRSAVSRKTQSQRLDCLSSMSSRSPWVVGFLAGLGERQGHRWERKEKEVCDEENPSRFF